MLADESQTSGTKARSGMGVAAPGRAVERAGSAVEFAVQHAYEQRRIGLQLKASELM